MCLVSIFQFSEHFQLIFDNSNVKNNKQIKQKIGNFSRIIKFFFLILLGKATLETKVDPTNRNNSAFLLHTSKTFSNVELFSIFSQTFLELIFATKLKTILLRQSAVLFTSCQYWVYYVSEHLKYCIQINEY